MTRQQIVVGVVYNKSRDKVLVSKRRLDSHMGGMWEFPGGKKNKNENVLTALKRELYEEINLGVISASPLLEIKHDYPDKKVMLDVWKVDDWTGELYGKEGQDLEWVYCTRLREKNFPAANSRIICVVALSPLYVITPDLDSYDESFLENAKTLIEGGVKLFQFRNKTRPIAAYETVIRKLADMCNEHGCLFLYNGTPENLARYGAHGIHLGSSELLKCFDRPVSDQYWVATSCHNVSEIKHAVEIGADFCVLSPVHQTGTHDTGKPLGWEYFKEMAETSDIPVYALGGVKPDEINIALEHGAHGIATISGIWNTQNPAGAIRYCLKS